MIFIKMCKWQNLCQQERCRRAIFMFQDNSSPHIQILVLLIVEITMVEHHCICCQCIKLLWAPQQSNKVQSQALPIFLHFYTCESMTVERCSLSTIRGLWHNSNHPCET
jgi:hypothetical protein